jgi:hypothetical protein
VKCGILFPVVVIREEMGCEDLVVVKLPWYLSY